MQCPLRPPLGIVTLSLVIVSRVAKTTAVGQGVGSTHKEAMARAGRSVRK